MNCRSASKILQQYFKHCIRRQCKRTWTGSQSNLATSLGRCAYHHLWRDGHQLTYARILKFRKQFNLGSRFLSDFRNDDEVKSWLKEIRDDFEKEAKVDGINSDCVDELSHIDTEQSKEISNEHRQMTMFDGSQQDHEVSNCVEKHPLDEVHFEEIHGFTADELINVLNVLEKTDNSLKSANDPDLDSDIESDESDSDIEHTGDADLRKIKDVKPENRSSPTQEGGGSTTGFTGGNVTSLKTDWSVVEIEDFVNLTREEEEEEEETWRLSIHSSRGQSGVYDLPDLVSVLRSLNAVDVIVIGIPLHIEFAQQMVIASAKSQRHLSAMAMEVNRIYKLKKHRRDKFLKLEGEGTDWVAIDLENMVLHLFMPKVREQYDLETLWTVGEEFDPLCVVEDDPYVFTADDLPWLDELEERSQDEDGERSQRQK